jgi:hypothetical protein
VRTLVVSVFPKNHSRYDVVDGLMHEEAVALFKRFYARENRAGGSTKSPIWINTEFKKRCSAFAS